jgi:hypothetical protein
MSSYVFNTTHGKCSVTVHELNGVVGVVGQCHPSATVLKYVAAAPADCRQSYMGTGLPFPSPEVAYQSKNIGVVPIVNGRFQFTIRRPNSYYVECGTQLIEPHVHIYIGKALFNVPLGKGIPLRSLSSLPGMPNRSSHR